MTTPDSLDLLTHDEVLYSAKKFRRQANELAGEVERAEAALAQAKTEWAAAGAEVEQLRQRLDLAEGRLDGDAWDRLTEERDEARMELRNRTAAVNVISDELELMTQERDEALSAQIVVQCDDPEHADRERMRPVVEAAKRVLDEYIGLDELHDAVDTYESQEGTDGN